MINNIDIRSIPELKEFFHNNKNNKDIAIYVSTKIRREWMLNHKRIIISGKVYDIDFKNKGGGVWLASLDSKIGIKDA